MPITPEFFSFLVENRLHDSKAWFESHREDYNRLVLEPLRGLVEEMAPFLGRAILLHQGKLVADAATADLEEAGTDLVTFCKETYQYQANRVAKALARLTHGEEAAP